MYEINDVKKTILCVTDRMEEISDELTEIDSRLGDGDMGISMAKGAAAVRDICRNYQGDSIKMLLMQCASALNKAAPSTMGTLLSGALLALARYTAERSALEERDLAQIVKVMADAISARGRAKVGDKTILDAMMPYAETMAAVWEEEKNLSIAHKSALKAAQEGLESTKGMRAKTGRASWLGDRNSEFPDGGALMFCRIMEIF